MKLAAIAGFAAGTAIVVYTFLRQHSTEQFLRDQSGNGRHLTWRTGEPSVTLDRSTTQWDPDMSVWYTFTSAELGEPT